MNKWKLLQKVWVRPKTMRVAEVVTLAEAFGFRLAGTNGSHHIFTHPQVPELLNLQEKKGKAKPYLIKQLLLLIEQYNRSVLSVVPRRPARDGYPSTGGRGPAGRTLSDRTARRGSPPPSAGPSLPPTPRALSLLPPSRRPPKRVFAAAA